MPKTQKPTPTQGNAAHAPGVERRMTEIASLLRSLDDTASNSGRSSTAANEHENQLVQVRLGVASSLFMALRCKHAPTAGHSMRVALGCSAWTLAMDLDDKQRDHIEVAALLHDVGKIGVPDHILQKPGKLSDEETDLAGNHWKMGQEILSCCCAPQEILDIVKYASAWYDGSKRGFDKHSSDLPLGARVVSIVDAFDAMTTDQVYRRAMSRERALAELFEYAGKQFDPELVRGFNSLHEESQLDLHAKVSQRWLEALAPELSNGRWALNTDGTPSGLSLPVPMFQQKMVDNMHDGVVFVDNQLQIFLWNRGAERLSGITGGAAYQRAWAPSLVAMRDERGSIVKDQDCPVRQAMDSGVQTLRRLSIAGRNGKDQPIDLHSVPVIGSDGTSYGVTLLLHDVAPETSLEERCQNLHALATKDPLTQVANRAEFDRVHALFLKTHVESDLPCSLIICDIDHFKHVNNNYGHQAGDEAIKSFANLLKSQSRHGDLVARYGGEEFVMLCADCDNASAAARAEQLRRALSETPQSMLGSKRITASFGVTENQAGDTPETMLRRADRALLQAKDTGRNRVVQLGTGTQNEESTKRRGWWFFRGRPGEPVLDTHLATPVPIDLAIQKLRGFIADQDAHIDQVDEENIELAIGSGNLPLQRRLTDRPIPMLVKIEFRQNAVENTNRQGESCGEQAQTRMHVVIRPRRSRDRRREQVTSRARAILASLRSYLMATEIMPDTPVQKAKKAMQPFLGKKEKE